MFSEYIEELRSMGKRSFTFQEIVTDLKISDAAARTGLYRLRKAGKLISPVNGLHVMVPPESRAYGSIPAEELVPIIMNYVGAEYYVALLSAAAYHGASHQKPARFQVISDKRIKHSLTFGQVAIELIYKKVLLDLPINEVTVSTGYLKVASPELVALDLLKYPKRSGGINHIATVLSELIEALNVNQLLQLAVSLDELGHLQRLGYLFEKIDVIDEDKQKIIVTSLEEYLKEKNRAFVPLVSSMPKKGCVRCRKWRVIENTDIESDL